MITRYLSKITLLPAVDATGFRCVVGVRVVDDGEETDGSTTRDVPKTAAVVQAAIALRDAVLAAAAAAGKPLTLGGP